MIPATLNAYLVISALLFAIGLLGVIVLSKKFEGLDDIK